LVQALLRIPFAANLGLILSAYEFTFQFVNLNQIPEQIKFFQLKFIQFDIVQQLQKLC